MIYKNPYFQCLLKYWKILTQMTTVNWPMSSLVTPNPPIAPYLLMYPLTYWSI